MKVSELINELIKLNPRLDVRVEAGGNSSSQWVASVEEHNTGSSGYELQGEVIINVSE
jgi:hypothetical protein